MKKLFDPERYRLPDRAGEPFIDPDEIRTLLNPRRKPTPEEVKSTVAKSLDKKRLTLAETATLLLADDPVSTETVLAAARELKHRVYGNRIVLFAPLYVGNRCTNNCLYCGFRASNRDVVRRTLTPAEIVRETEALVNRGQKRLILVYGEHPLYSAEYIAGTVRAVYGVRKGPGVIRRVNINAAPLDVEGFRTVKEAGIGTFQIFQETYDPELYRSCHPSGRKSDYTYRLTALDRAMQAGIDDVGLGALFGLGDWRFEALALVRHAAHLEACFGVGPHTVSFPRIQEASSVDGKAFRPLSDDDFLRLIAVLRLAVPYTGLILTAREPAALRDRAIAYGVSQIDGGTRIEIGGYTKEEDIQQLDREQFLIHDDRSLEEIVGELLPKGHLPSFCTACYRKGRTGEHFMEFSVPGFIKRYCTPNAVLTLAEYLEDYAPADLREKGYAAIEREMRGMEEGMRTQVSSRLDRIRAGRERDLCF